MSFVLQLIFIRFLRIYTVNNKGTKSFIQFAKGKLSCDSQTLDVASWHISKMSTTFIPDFRQNSIFYFRSLDLIHIITEFLYTRFYLLGPYPKFEDRFHLWNGTPNQYLVLITESISSYLCSYHRLQFILGAKS